MKNHFVLIFLKEAYKFPNSLKIFNPNEEEQNPLLKGYTGNWIEYYNAELHLSNQNKLIKKEISFFNNNKLTGLYEYYYKNGFVKISGYYHEGKKDGTWKLYNEKGKLVKIENYEKGHLDGDFKLFFEDGITEKLIGKYKNNKRAETWFCFFDVDKKSNLKINYSK